MLMIDWRLPGWEQVKHLGCSYVASYSQYFSTTFVTLPYTQLYLLARTLCSARYSLCPVSALRGQLRTSLQLQTEQQLACGVLNIYS